MLFFVAKLYNTGVATHYSLLLYYLLLIHLKTRFAAKTPQSISFSKCDISAKNLFRKKSSKKIRVSAVRMYALLLLQSSGLHPIRSNSAEVLRFQPYPVDHGNGLSLSGNHRRQGDKIGRIFAP
jgi:hypothetical protein